MVVFPLGNLKQSSDALQASLLYRGDQLTSPALTYKKFRKEERVEIHVAKGNAGTVKLKTNLGTKWTN